MTTPVWNPHFLERAAAYSPLRRVGAALAHHDHWPDVHALNALLAAQPVHTESGARLRVVAQGEAPAAGADRLAKKYEARIYRHGELQTRTQNWHDLFNLLAWLHFPRTKARLNALHYRELLHASGHAANRSKLQDALTIFDEGGLIVASTDAQWLELIRTFQWKTLFWEQRAAVVRDMRFYLFGHALYEKALTPYKGLTAKAVLLQVSSALFATDEATRIAHLDTATADWFGDGSALTSTQMLAPVPILGIPGWDSANEHGDYYDDTEYFRSGYRRRDKRKS